MSTDLKGELILIAGECIDNGRSDLAERLRAIAALVTVTDALVERVCRRLHDSWPMYPNATKKIWRDDVRAALELVLGKAT